jgi:hypothetical protein
VPVAGGPALIDREVGHGEDPAVLFRREGFNVRRLLSAKGTLPDIVVTAEVAQRRDWTARLPKFLRGTPEAPEPAGEPGPERRQRLASYVIAL